MTRRESLEEKSYGFQFVFDPTLIENSVIFNQRTGNVEVCAVARLEGTDVEFRKVYAIETRPRGSFSFTNSWSSGNRLGANYLVRTTDADVINGELLQKDCSTPIDDTDVLAGKYISYWYGIYSNAYFDYTFDSATARDSVLFDEATSSIEVCHVVRLGDTAQKDERIIRIQVPRPVTVAGLFGDPHIMTFDGLQYECQGSCVFDCN